MEKDYGLLLNVLIMMMFCLLREMTAKIYMLFFV